MAIEIERKFRVTGADWRILSEKSLRMAQGYLNDADALAQGRERCSVRVRLADDIAFLNIKSREIGPAREEYEYAIPMADAEALLKLCSGGLIDKIRHHVRVGGHLWEVDEFLGDNAGLVVAEIELDAVDEVFERPAWLANEVTELTRYYNLALAARPYAQWTDEEKA